MTPEQIKAWQAHLKLSNTAAAGALNVNVRTYADWRSGRTRTPGCLALACSAVAMGLPPYGERKAGAGARGQGDGTPTCE